MSALNMDDLIASALAKVQADQKKEVAAKRRSQKDQADKIASRRIERNQEARKVRQRNVADKAELLLMECAPIIVRHLDTKRCMECFSPLPDVVFDPQAEEVPEKCADCGYSIKQSIRRQTAGLDGARIIIRCSKGERGAFSAAIQLIGEKADNARNYPPATLRQLAEKNDWVGRKSIEWLTKDDRTKDEKGNILGFNTHSVPEMLEELVRLRKLVHCQEDEIERLKQPQTPIEEIGPCEIDRYLEGQADEGQS